MTDKILLVIAVYIYIQNNPGTTRADAALAVVADLKAAKHFLDATSITDITG